VTTSLHELVDLAHVITKGTTPTTLGLSFAESGVPFIRVQNIKNGQVDPTIEPLFISESAHRTLRRSRILPGDLLVSIAGTIGRTGLVPNSAEEMNCNQAVAIIRLRSAIHDRYALHLLQSEDVHAQMRQGQVTGTITNLSLTQLGKLKVAIPPLAEQRRIAAILDQADALRAKRRQTLTQLDEMVRAVFIEMFGLPKKNSFGWPLYRLSDFCSPKQWPTITSQELLSEGHPVFGANGVIGYYSEYNHIEPTVLITCRGATCGTINICLPKSYVTGNSMALDDPEPKLVEIHYLAAALRERGLEDAISGSAQPQITRQSLDPIQLPLPPIEMQRDFSRKIQSLQFTRELLLKDAVELDAFFASLQHRAFRGEL
jgi:type I restriction enzyme S subunit